MTLNQITYRYIYDLTAFFLPHLKRKDKKEFDLLIRRVKSRVPHISNFKYVFDESIWYPDNPELYNNHILFMVQLSSQVEIFRYSMLVDNGMDQDMVSAPLLEVKVA